MCYPLSMWKMLLVVRVLTACLISTSGPPDEYWQGPEVAYHMIYGKGELTWEWNAGIRGYLHPTMYAVLFEGFRLVGMDSRGAILYSPKLLHGVLTFIGDIYTVKLSEKWYPDNSTVHKLTLVFCVINWFISYCTTRTLSNSIEAVVTVVALTYFDESSRKQIHKDALFRYSVFLMFAGLCCAIRPTAAVLWLPCVCIAIVNKPLYIIPTTVCAVFWLTETTCIDFLVSGEWGVSQLRFLEFNFIEGKSAVFGTHPWHWYFTQGFPAMMGTMTPFFIIVLIEEKIRNFGTYLVIWGLFVYSLIGHKEFRFVLPLLNLAMPGIAAGYESLCRRLGKQLYNKWFYIIVLVPNLIAGVYFCFIHQRGALIAVIDLSYEMETYEERINAFEVKDVLRVDSLLPCYQTPGLSYVHSTKITHITQWNCTPIFSLSGSLQPTEHSLFREHPVELTEWTYGRLSRPNSTTLLKTFSLIVPQPRRMPQFFLIYSHHENLFSEFFKRGEYVFFLFFLVVSVLKYN